MILISDEDNKRAELSVNAIELKMNKLIDE